MKLGSNDIGSVYIGSTAVNKIYIGNTEVWSSFTGLLDTYSGAAAAYSLRLLSSTYSGDSIRVRRASDNAESDIGFVSGQLDTTTLETFCSGTNGYVTTWYDQSGNGNNATQTTASYQPQIVSSGSVITENGKPCLSFDGTDDVFNSTISGMQNFTNLSSFIVNVPTNASQPNVSTSSLFYYANGGGTQTTQKGLQWGLATASLNNETYTMYFSSNTIGGRLGSSTYSHNANEQIINSTFNLSSGSSAYKNGSQITLNLSAGNINTTTNTSPSNCDIASDDIQLSRTVNQKYQEAIFYPSNQSSNRTGIESNINTHYNIY